MRTTGWNTGEPPHERWFIGEITEGNLIRLVLCRLNPREFYIGSDAMEYELQVLDEDRVYHFDYEGDHEDMWNWYPITRLLRWMYLP